jgi:hypothetical protein
MTTHVLVLIHGITPEPEPNVLEQYSELVKAVDTAGLPFTKPVCQVEWGVPRNGQITRPDQYLSKAERAVDALLDKPAPAGSEQSVPGKGGHDWGIPGARQLINRGRERLVQFGLSDALYYAAPDGEKAVRDTVFDQVFGKLEASEDGEIIHLHIVAHSLGVTVAHDFLYALFGMVDPGFPTQPEATDPGRLNDVNHALQEKWRGHARAGRLALGTFISFASQLPLFMMRKQALVEKLARGETLDPSVIGIDTARTTVQWAIFHDSDELLGFPSRALYRDTRAIADVNMNSGLEPLGAHLGYWRKPAIIERCIALLRQNTR